MKLRPERRNAIKVLLFLDVGGSMDWHIGEAEALFSAAKMQFKRLEHFYFHNCLYESVWKENRRRFEARLSTADLFNLYGPDHRAIFVGDASMSPHEIMAPGGSVEHLNAGDRRSLAQSRRRPRGRAASGSIRRKRPRLELFAIDADDFARAVRRAHVRADARRGRGGDEGAVALSARSLTGVAHQDWAPRLNGPVSPQRQNEGL